MKLPALVIAQIRRRVEAVVQDAVWEHAEDIELPEDDSMEWADQIVEAMMDAATGVDAPKGGTE